MNLISIIALLYILFFVTICGIYNRVKDGEKHYSIAFMLMIISLCVVAYSIKPTASWDLYRHYIYLDRIRTDNISLFDFLFSYPKYANQRYSSLLVFNIIRYICAKIFSNNSMLPVICTLIVYSIIFYIGKRWHNIYNEQFNPLQLLLCFSFLPPIYVFSGIRNAVAASVVGLGIYLYLVEKKSAWVYLVSLLISVLVHPIVLITLPYVFLANRLQTKKGIIIVAAFSIVLPVVANLFFYSGNTFLSSLGSSYLLYTSDEQYKGNVYYQIIITVIVAALVLKILSNHQDRDENRAITYFVLFYGFFIIGNIGNYDLTVRSCYVLGALAYPVYSNIEYIDGSNIRYLPYIRIGLVLLCLYENYRFLLSIISVM